MRACFFLPHSPWLNPSSTVQHAPFGKPHWRAYRGCAAVFLMYWRSAHGTARSKNHASMIFSPVQSMAELCLTKV